MERYRVRIYLTPGGDGLVSLTEEFDDEQKAAQFAASCGTSAYVFRKNDEATYYPHHRIDYVVLSKIA
jgi:hypothetical protein